MIIRSGFKEELILYKLCSQRHVNKIGMNCVIFDFPRLKLCLLVAYYNDAVNLLVFYYRIAFMLKFILCFS